MIIYFGLFYHLAAIKYRIEDLWTNGVQHYGQYVMYGQSQSIVRQDTTRIYNMDTDKMA